MTTITITDFDAYLRHLSAHAAQWSMPYLTMGFVAIQRNYHYAR